MARFEGIMTPVFTPFKPCGELNVELIPEYTEYLWQRGVKGVYVCGTAGEGLSLTEAERKILAEEWVKAAKKFPLTVIVMVGAGGLRTSQILAAHAASLGVDGIASICCLYDKPANINELIDYCKEVAMAAPSTPFYYYHIPFKTGVNFAMDEFLSLGSKVIPTLAGMKFTSNAVADEGLRCLQLENRKFNIFSGFDQTLAEALQLGFTCAINGCFNFLVEDAAKMFDNSKKQPKDYQISNAKQQMKIDQVLNAIFSFSNGGFSVSSVKAAMPILTGLDVGPPRKPLVALTAEQKARMKVKLDAILTN